MRVAESSRSSASVLIVTGPLSVTKENGGVSSSTHRLAWPVRASERPLTVLSPVLKTSSSPSSTKPDRPDVRASILARRRELARARALRDELLPLGLGHLRHVTLLSLKRVTPSRRSGKRD